MGQDVETIGKRVLHPVSISFCGFKARGRWTSKEAEGEQIEPVSEGVEDAVPIRVTTQEVRS